MVMVAAYRPAAKFIQMLRDEGYIAATVFVEALRRAGRDVNTETLVSAFESIRDLDLGIGTNVSFGLSEHQGSHKVWSAELDGACLYRVLDMD